MEPVFPIAPRTCIPVQGSTAGFPINRVYCVGRNYAAHAIEMGHDPDREPPFFFAKPADAVLCGAQLDLPYPPLTQDLHHEVELVIGLKSGGRNIAPEQALDHIYGAAVGLDFTRRDLQGTAKKAGRPWDMGKGFDGSAAIGVMTPVTPETLPQQGEISLLVNGDTRQHSDLSKMIWNIAETISSLSTYLTLRAGDAIFTGTPEGVGAVTQGDVLTAQCAGLTSMQVTITPPL